MRVLVLSGNQHLQPSVKALPLFRNTRIVRAGRLLTAKQFAARQRRSKFAGIGQFLQQEIAQMSVIAESAQESERVRNFLASPRAIRNHSKGR